MAARPRGSEGLHLQGIWPLVVVPPGAGGAGVLTCGSSDDVETITLSSVDVDWLASDLNHALVKHVCRDQDVIDVSERLDYVDDSGDGSLDGWYC